MKQIDTKYNEAVQQIKSAILQSRLEAAKVVNRRMLALYYGIGKFYELWKDVLNRQPVAGDLDIYDFFSISFANKTYVEYLLQDYNQPMCVATYQVLPKKLKKVLSPEDEMKKLLFAKRDNKEDKEK